MSLCFEQVQEQTLKVLYLQLLTTLARNTVVSLLFAEQFPFSGIKKSNTVIIELQLIIQL